MDGVKAALLLQALAIADQSRGKHSTGLAIITPEKAILRKKALSGEEFVSQGDTEFLFKSRILACLGHNRFATAGAITDRNAHPFAVRVDGKWNFGIHNGCVGRTRRLAKIFQVEEADVDSETVFRAIARQQNGGVKVGEAISKVSEVISGSADFAFVYLNRFREKALYLWRSPDRPLAVIDARKLGLGRWFCSTAEIFEKAWASLRGILGNIEKAGLFEAAPYRLYRIEYGPHSDLEVTAVRELECRPVSGCRAERNYAGVLGEGGRQLSFLSDGSEDRRLL
ncbi:MAG: hypothetical protein HZA04_02915 [Nitrospinae bacterium]|nr:hypothetical protein [Nitrospinota bacterium]